MTSNVTIIPFLNKVNEFVLNPLIALVFTVSFAYFTYGIVRFLSLDAADAKRVEARNAIMWGIIGMAIMFSVYGIIGFVLTSFGITNPSPAATPFLFH